MTRLAAIESSIHVVIGMWSMFLLLRDQKSNKEGKIIACLFLALAVGVFTVRNEMRWCVACVNASTSTECESNPSRWARAL